MSVSEHAQDYWHALRFSELCLIQTGLANPETFPAGSYLVDIIVNNTLNPSGPQWINVCLIVYRTRRLDWYICPNIPHPPVKLSIDAAQEAELRPIIAALLTDAAPQQGWEEQFRHKEAIESLLNQ